MNSYLLYKFVSLRSRFPSVTVLLIAVFIHAAMAGLFTCNLHAQTNITDKKSTFVSGKSAEKEKSSSHLQPLEENASESGLVPLPMIDLEGQHEPGLPSVPQQPQKTLTDPVWLLLLTGIVSGLVFCLWRVNVTGNAIKYLSEFMGTFALIFVGAGCVCADYYLVKSGSQGFGLLGIAIAFGVVVVAVAYSFGYVSGAHINPAVTISMVVSNRMDAKTGFLYIVSQTGGAVFGGFLLKILFPAAMAVNLGTCSIGPGITTVQAIVMEAVITFLLVFVVYATVIDKRATPALAGLTIGLVVLFGVMVGGAVSGGSMNPARVFGPALASGHFENHYVWWLGPIAGGVLAGLVYEKFFAVREKQQLADPSGNNAMLNEVKA